VTILRSGTGGLGLGMAIGLLLALVPVHASAAPSADLSIVKTGPATAVAGTNLTYSR
jgi:hypothetical protein